MNYVLNSNVESYESLVSDSISYSFKFTKLSENVHHYTLKNNSGSDLSFSDFLNLMIAPSSDVALAFTEALKQSEFKAYFWECPPLTRDNVGNKSVEFVLVDSKVLLESVADPKDFTEHLEKCENAVTSFPNLRGDALLIVPCPSSKDMIQPYSHLASFVREAPFSRISELWRELSKECLLKLMSMDSNHDKIWISTSGLGVSWLHIRIDSSPKYYNHLPYKNEA